MPPRLALRRLALRSPPAVPVLPGPVPPRPPAVPLALRPLALRPLARRPVPLRPVWPRRVLGPARVSVTAVSTLTVAGSAMLICPIQTLGGILTVAATTIRMNGPARPT
jgi:hypothetical protein